ncbi:MAG: diguanylate cyclase response regulator [Rhodocyclales bacterium GWA2_65_20]|nr:MAG: diguanylate cyclase response regulator [Rhodocyclales bacterium GWA2_65_20]
MEEKSGTVLVIDDSPAIARQLFEALDDSYHVLVATDGADGIEVAAAQRPDLILLDVVMPGLNGYDVCIRLKQDPRTQGIPIIFITARDEEEDEELGLSLGAIDYLTKPLRPAIVRARVKNHTELKRSRDLLQRLTTLDPLTGIDNRRRFDDYLAVEWCRAAREEHVLSLIMIDIDHFKRVNDRQGHALGDRCLAKVAATLQASVMRPGDLVARYGGEEFVCVLPGTDIAGAGQLAERMRAAIEALAIIHGDSPVAAHVTVSLGVAAALPHAATTISGLIEAADLALYEAKRSGRNRVCVRREPAPLPTLQRPGAV